MLILKKSELKEFKKLLKVKFKNVLIEFKDKKVYIKFINDNETLIKEYESENNITENILVNFKDFKDVFKNKLLEKYDVNFEIIKENDKKKLIISNSLIEFKLSETKDFIPIFNYNDLNIVSYVVNGKEFIKTLKKAKVFLATGKDNVNSVLKNVNGIIKNNNQLELVSSDGYKLYKNTINIYKTEINMLENDELRFTKKQIDILEKIFDSEKPLAISIGIFSELIFQEKISLLVNKNADKYPDYNRVIPEPVNYRANIKLETEFMIELLKNIKETRLILKTFDNKLIIEATKDLYDKTNMLKTEIPLLEKHGNNFTIGVNSKYLLDVLKNIDNNIINMHIVNEMSPIVIQDEKKTTELFLVLPIKLLN